MLLTLVIDLALRPTLGPDEFPEREPFAFRMPRPLDFGPIDACGTTEPIFNVNQLLRAGEPMAWEVEPEDVELDGNPSRRRSVRPDPHDARSSGVIQGTTTLVSDVGGVRERRRLRHPAL